MSGGCACAVVELDSEWSTIPMIVGFCTNALGRLAPRASCRTLI